MNSFKNHSLLFVLVGVFLLGRPFLYAETSPAYWQWAQTPAMGWNSYDALGTSITEDETLANAEYMKDHLLFPRLAICGYRRPLVRCRFIV